MKKRTLEQAVVQDVLNLDNSGEKAVNSVTMPIEALTFHGLD